MIGVVAAADSSVQATFEACDAPVTIDSATAVLDADPDVIVAHGRAGVAAILDTGAVASTPIMAIDASDGLPANGDPALYADRLAAADPPTVSHPTILVRVDDEEVGRVAFDAMIVASDPGAIGEYRLTVGSDADQVRADGIVVATPAGSHDYARSAGGPRVQPRRNVASVVPVGAFTMSPRRWVADLEDTVRVSQRREVESELLLDGQEHSIAPGGTMELQSGPPLEFVNFDTA